MRKWIKILLNRYLESYYQNRVGQEIEKISARYIKESEIKRIQLNYPKGTKVIIRSNEPEPLIVGTVEGFENIADKVLIRVKDLKTDKILIPLNNDLMIYTKERKEALDKLDWAEQFNVMSKYYYFIPKHVQKKKEANK